MLRKKKRQNVFSQDLIYLSKSLENCSRSEFPLVLLMAVKSFG